MALQVGVKVRGQERYASVLDRLNPKENPQAFRLGLEDAGDELLHELDAELSGPRPRRLDEVTGELRRSPTEDRSRLSRFELEAGVPADLFWIAFYELGLGRFRKYAPVLTALEDALDVVPDLMLARWEAAASRVPA